MQRSTAIIIGAGPAGLTAAYELLARTAIRPVVLEMSEHMGGISRTVDYKGNRMDIGGHRFFSKSDRVMDWWFQFLPLEKVAGGIEVAYRGGHRWVNGLDAEGPDPTREDRVMLLRSRLSRIFFRRKFYRYPISINLQTVANLGLLRTVWIGLSYLRAALFPVRPEKSLEDFFINRFGRQLYFTFFKSYTEKVWGVPCTALSAEWGAQRVKGLSVWKALAHVARSAIPAARSDIFQKKTETSLIEKFFYPKFGPGQMWREVARRVCEQQGEILTGWRVHRVEHHHFRRIVAVEATHSATGEIRRFEADLFFSTMPVKELIAALHPPAPAPILEVSDGLVYRDFISVGLLCRRLAIHEPDGARIKDNWIYIHERDVQVGRLQIFNNWSPYLVADPSTTWIGLEYFCDQNDSLWQRSDAEMLLLAKDELARLQFVDSADVLDGTVVRMPKAYPAYFGTYSRFAELSAFTDQIENLYLIGRNGMHRYNNQDHSMLAAMTAVDNILSGERSRANLWSLNTEMDYQEQKPAPPPE